MLFTSSIVYNILRFALVFEIIFHLREISMKSKNLSSKSYEVSIILNSTTCSCESLRSRASFLLQHGKETLYVWRGCKSSKHTHSGCLGAARHLVEKLDGKPTIVEVSEDSTFYRDELSVHR